jgi:conserved domain
MESDSKDIPWNEIIKKEAVGINNDDLGKVQEVSSVSILTKKGFLNTEFFDIPKSLVERYDGDKVYFTINEEQARSFSKRNSSITTEKEKEDYSINHSKITVEDENNDLSSPSPSSSIDSKNNDIVIPLMSEELVVTKKEVIDEVTITKEPTKETKTEQVQLMHEEINIERRPVNNLTDSANTSTTKEDIPPIESKTEIKIPLKREEIEVTKKPYVKEEIVIKRKPVSETRRISEEIRTEQIVEPENI